MFDLKVKTLDGQTHEFSVPDDATVLQFKEIISEKMEIAVDRQRLLYQGRVLIDENLLSSYEVAGNVMHLVTRLPPQSRAAPEVTVEREENSDINRDQIRNILSDVFNNIGDLNNPMGVSVNNEGNRMDITVNIPTQNRLSLSRLRQNYVLRLLNQARNVVNNMEDPSLPQPRPDRDRLRQADPYDIGQNDERLTEITSQPLPISNLADMISLTRSLWTSAEPQLEIWESVLRRENNPDSTPRTEVEMQRIHDSTSRYVHLFSHILHILSDYLVEFHPSGSVTRATAAEPNIVETAATDAATSVSVDDSNSPLTNACGESGMVTNDSANGTTANAGTETAIGTVPVDIIDRSRYLYVFSEMPAQLVQVRLDVDSNIRDLGATNTTTIPAAAQVNVQTPRSTESTPVTESSPNTAQTNTDPSNIRLRSQRRIQANGNTMENIFRTTIQDTIMGSNMRPQMTNGSRNVRSTPQFMDNVDPYLRCQSRHFQHPSNLRSGAVISAISGIRLRDTSRPRTVTSDNSGVPTTHITTTTSSTTIPMNNVRSQSTDTDPVRTLLSGLMNSIFQGPGDNPRQQQNAPAVNIQADRQTGGPQNMGSDIQRIVQTLFSSGGSNLNAPLTQIFPEMLNNQDLDPENFVTNQIVQIVISRLTLADLMGVVRGQYTPLNQLRIPLQEILANHQRDAGSRDLLIDHVVSDLEFFNRAYISVFEKLRNGELTDRLSEEARCSFNMRLDIFQTINNLNRYHFQSMIDMIMRSPTNQGFGQLLMNSLILHHNESLALIDIICNNNDELRQFLIRSFLDSLISSMNPGTDATNGQPHQSMQGLDLLFGDINSGLFQRPEQLAELKEHTLNHFAVYYSENGNAAATSTTGDVDEISESIDSIEEMVTNLSENIVQGAIVAELQRPLWDDGNERMDTDVGAGEGPVAVIGGGGGSGAAGSDWRGVVPSEWVQIMARDNNHDVRQSGLTSATEGPVLAVPYSDAYVAGMPPKRRKVIMSQRTVQKSADMMHDCIDQAIKGAGLATGLDGGQAALLPAALTGAFQEMVAERVRARIADERQNFPGDRYPTAELNFARKKRSDETENNNNN